MAGGTASQTFDCAGGGTALFTVTGSNLGNGQLDAGEVYSVSYTACKGAAGVGRADRQRDADGGVGQRRQRRGEHLDAEPPDRAAAAHADHQRQFDAVAHRHHQRHRDDHDEPLDLAADRGAERAPRRTSTFTLTNVDLTRSVTIDHGVITARSSSGTHTMSARCCPTATGR